MTIHEEATLAYMDAAPTCGCWRCRHAGITAVLAAVSKRLRAIEARADDEAEKAGKAAAGTWITLMAKHLHELCDEMENERTTT